jgi:hypothetical protein
MVIILATTWLESKITRVEKKIKKTILMTFKNSHVEQYQIDTHRSDIIGWSTAQKICSLTWIGCKKNQLEIDLSNRWINLSRFDFFL